MQLYRILFIAFFIIPGVIMAQVQPGAKVVLLFKDTVAITLHVDIGTANPELVNASQINEDGTTQSIKINTGVVSSFFINNQWYKFKDLKNGYKDSETMRNCCAKLITGTDSLGLF